MTKSERDAIVAYIDQQAGPVPSLISDQLAIMDEVVGRMPTGEDRDKLRAVFQAILEANLQLGTSPGEELTNPGVILWLRQRVLALPVDEETPPVVTPGPPAGTIHVTPNGTVLPPLDPDGRNRSFLATPGTIYVAALTGPADRVSDSADGGMVNLGVTGHGVGSYPHSALIDGRFVAGDTVFVGIPADRAQTNILYSALKYA